MSSGRHVRLLIISILVVGVVPGVSRAQTSDPADDDATTGSTRPTGFTPRYNSTFDSFKERNTWKQGMTLNWGLSNYFGSSSLTSSRTEDQAQNDLDLAASGWQNRAEVLLGHGLSLGLSGNFNRSRRLTTASQIRNTTDDYGVVGGWRSSFGQWFSTLNGQAGEKVVYAETKRVTSGAASLDRTNQSGPRFQLGGSVKNYEGAVKPTVSMEFSANTDAFRQETRERRDAFDLDFTQGVAERDTSLNTTNRSQRYVASFGWTPIKGVTVDLVGTRSTGQDLRPLAFQDGLERTETDDRLVDVGVRYKRGDLNLVAEFKTGDRRGSSSATPSANKDATSEEARLAVDYKWLGTSLKSYFRSTSRRDDYRPVAGRVANEDQDSDVKDFKITAIRPLTSRVSAEVVFQAYIDQKFYETQFLDNDRRNLSTDFTLKYEPPTIDMNASVAFSYRNVRTVAVNESRSANTNTGEELLAVFTMQYRPYNLVLIDQRVAIAANSAVYDFDDDGQSDLTRRNDVNTKVAVDLLAHVVLDIKHIYNFTNQGSYALGIDGIRRFGLSDERSRQELNVGMSYDPLDWLGFRVAESLEATVSKRPDSPESRSTVRELELQANGSRTFSEVVTSFDVKRVLTTREDDYWKLVVGVNRAF